MYSSSRGSSTETKTNTRSSTIQNTSRRSSSRNMSMSTSRRSSSNGSNTHPNPERWWNHRRRGFYIGLWWTAIQTVIWIAIGIYDTEVIKALGIVVGWCYAISATLIVAYYGNNAIEAFSSRAMSGR